MKDKWKRVTVCLSDEEYAQMKFLASLRKESVAAFVRYLLGIHLKANHELYEIMKKAHKITAKPS